LKREIEKFASPHRRADEAKFNVSGCAEERGETMQPNTNRKGTIVKPITNKILATLAAGLAVPALALAQAGGSGSSGGGAAIGPVNGSGAGTGQGATGPAQKMTTRQTTGTADRGVPPSAQSGQNMNGSSTTDENGNQTPRTNNSNTTFAREHARSNTKSSNRANTNRTTNGTNAEKNSNQDSGTQH
jgi:hypothetical protein